MSLEPTLKAVACAVLFFCGCKVDRDTVRNKLEAQGYTNVLVDPADNDHGVFHWTGQKPFETCRGTFLDADDRLMSTTCWPRERTLKSASATLEPSPSPAPTSSVPHHDRDGSQ